MILLDTDHFSVYTEERDLQHQPFQTRLEAATAEVACTIVTVEEVLRGWLAVIHRLREFHRKLSAYSPLGRLLDVLFDWDILPFDESAADRFAELRRQRTRTGTMDLKIASIALINTRCCSRRTCAISLRFRDYVAKTGCSVPFFRSRASGQRSRRT